MQSYKKESLRHQRKQQFNKKEKGAVPKSKSAIKK